MPWLTGGHTEALKACVLGGKENEDGGRTQAPAKVLSQMSEAATCAQRWGGVQNNYSHYGVNLYRTSLRRNYQAACSGQEGAGVAWFPATTQSVMYSSLAVSFQSHFPILALQSSRMDYTNTTCKY